MQLECLQWLLKWCNTTANSNLIKIISLIYFTFTAKKKTFKNPNFTAIL